MGVVRFSLKNSAHILSCAALISAFFAVTTRPAEAQAARTFFACRTTSGKFVRFSGTRSMVTYSYGRPGAPDLVFSVPRASVRFDVGMGAHGGAKSIAVTFNGVVYEGQYWWDAHGPEEAMIVVTRGSQTLANTACQSNLRVDIRDTD